jgi:ubiquinone/menaquinone biosynthesis C-methylase UbiE
VGWDEQFALRYDEWSARMTEDVPFYVGLAVDIDGPLVELAIGSGRVAIPVALATGRTVIGIDSSPAMFAQARAAAAGAGVALDLREGDIVILSPMSQRASSTVPSGRSFTSRRGPTEGVC